MATVSVAMVMLVSEYGRRKPTDVDLQIYTMEEAVDLLFTQQAC